MNEFLSQIKTETSSLIWFPQGQIDQTSQSYKFVDYLSDGILTSSLNSNEKAMSLVLVGTSFGSSLYIFIAHQLVKNEVESFFSLVNKDSNGDILVIDENDKFNDLTQLTPQAYKSRLKRVTAATL